MSEPEIDIAALVEAVRSVPPGIMTDRHARAILTAVLPLVGEECAKVMDAMAKEGLLRACSITAERGAAAIRSRIEALLKDESRGTEDA